MVRLGGGNGRKPRGSPLPDLSYGGPGAPALSTSSSFSDVIPMITGDPPSGGGRGAGGVVDRTATNSSSSGGGPSGRVASGVSALFRRGPSPIPPDDVGVVAGGGRDPAGVHATREGRIRNASTSSSTTGGGVVVVVDDRRRDRPNNPTIDRIRDGLTASGGGAGGASSSRQQQRRQRPPSAAAAAASGGGGSSYRGAGRASVDGGSSRHRPRQQDDDEANGQGGGMNSHSGIDPSVNLRLPRRYRGFSTSISSLFLDESIVCGAVSCWGLLLSSRTEHLLDERNVKRGLTRRGVGGEAGRGKEGGRRSPSFILSVAWIVTVLGVLATYAIWGFDSSSGYYDDLEDNDQADQNVEDYGADDANRRLMHVREWSILEDASSGPAASPRKHGFDGIMKLRDYKEHIFDPTVDVARRAYLNLMSQFNSDEYHPRYLAENDSAQVLKDYGQQVRAILIVVFLLLLGIIGRRRRMRTRFAIQRARAQDDHLFYASLLTKQGTSGSLATPDNTLMENFHEREDKYDGACSHTLFGCYPVDSTSANYADYDDDQSVSTAGDPNAQEASTKKKRRGGDFMSRTMTTIFNCCCGVLCSCWCQLFSVCALAQEARETRLLLPPSMQRIDLITHQPFSEYAKDVNNVRRRFMERANRTWMQHFAALSHLSRYLILVFVLIVGFVVMTSLLHPMGGFGWGDAIILIATFSQSAIVLFIVFGIFHRSDLSFDAVVKFFAVGFCICVVTGFVIEGFLVLGIQWLLYISYFPPHWIWGESYDAWLLANDRILKTSAELVIAYIVAALVEELCKYYGFRFLEHPDLVFLTGLDRTAKQAMNSGGLDAYKYDSQLVGEFSRSQDTESLDSRSRRMRSSKKRAKMLSSHALEDDDDVEPELRTLQQQGAAITTGMISVAVGLACAENFLYVFFQGGTDDNIEDVSIRLTILLFRSLFPIHALGAAMQSINMIRKFIEDKHGGERNIGVGRIIFPAVLLHGTFDAILMCVNAYIDASYDRYYANGGTDDDATWVPPYNFVVINSIAVLGILGVMAVSFGWYSYQNKLQMLRLAKIDMSRSRYGRGRFNAPNLI
ncbi:hypothetical protein ACHAW5_010992 [Stephanodiscus triporus]|uniref:Uncharacterized protein n=1 Tax=Stephanodiscus triporus TaxID=2934178 RepID=A0ABD3NBJ9_9STRA